MRVPAGCDITLVHRNRNADHGVEQAVHDLVRSGKVMMAVDKSLLPKVRAARVTMDRPLSTTSMGDLGGRYVHVLCVSCAVCWCCQQCVTCGCWSIVRECACSRRALEGLRQGIPFSPLPGFRDRDTSDESIPHAPRRGYKPTLKEKRLALKNALR